MGEAWILESLRSARGRGKRDSGALSSLHPQELMAQLLNAALDRTGLPARDVEDVVVGCVSQFGEQGGCIARMSVLAAGWPPEATGVALGASAAPGSRP
jgi:acetyl-CoA C-acetyltransferase